MKVKAISPQQKLEIFRALVPKIDRCANLGCDLTINPDEAKILSDLLKVLAKHEGSKR